MGNDEVGLVGGGKSKRVGSGLELLVDLQCEAKVDANDRGGWGQVEGATQDAQGVCGLAVLQVDGTEVVQDCGVVGI